jgi:transcriptional regulator with XRE-family HTH domain
MSLKTSNYQLFQRLIQSWKPRAKKIKVDLKDIADEAGITSQYLTKIITGKFVKNPSIDTIEDFEAALVAAEEKFAADQEAANKKGV